MGEIFGNYLIENQASLAQGVFFSFLGAIFGILLTPKQSAPLINNSTSVKKSTQIFIQKVYVENKNLTPHNKKENNENSEIIIFYFVITAFVAFLYIKFHNIIMDYILGFTLAGFFSTITIAIKLHINNNYDNLNKLWTGILLVVWTVNLLHLSVMTKQIEKGISTESFSDFISSVGIEGINEYFYYVIGLLLLGAINVLVVILLINIYSVNQFRVSGGNISKVLALKTSNYVNKPKIMAVIVIVLSVLSLIFSTGTAYDLISNHVEGMSME